MANNEQAESNSKESQEFKVFITNQFMSLSKHIDGRFNTIEKRLDVIQAQHVSILTYFSVPYFIFVFEFHHHEPFQRAGGEASGTT
jgi:delta-aminolevulinic acid dehydratase/porphobilinogen synthase